MEQLPSGSYRVEVHTGIDPITEYGRLKKRSHLACRGRPFAEHRNVPDLRPDSEDRQLAWQQGADKLRGPTAPCKKI
jgi:hypothetical protein